MTSVDQKALAEWWRDLSRNAPAGLAGLWFGLVELEPGGWHVYVAGTDDFDGDDETAEWAVPPYAWSPSDRYFPFPEGASYETGVAAAAAVIAELEPWTAVAVEGVAAGYDDGDFEVVYPVG
jgi:hypothetical protein